MSQHHSGLHMYKEDTIMADRHHPHHSQQGPSPGQHLQHPRSSSIVHHQGPPPPHPNAYPPSHHGLQQHQYGQGIQTSQSHHPQEIAQYYGQPSPYSTASGSGTYNSSAAPETPEIMAAAQMSRPSYPSIYQTPQSNSPSSVASPSGHDQHARAIYGPSAHHLQQQSMYYGGPQQQYPPMPLQNGSVPYASHSQQQHPSMTSQPNSLLMSHPNGQHPMQHSSHQHQRAMTNSPRTKLEHIPHLQRPSSGPHGPPSQHSQQPGPPMSNMTNTTGSGVNPNAAPGPIPATTPLVVQQDDNGVQWIAFEYSRERIKMEYKIRCDVESVIVDNLTFDFKKENCVYPRACCHKDKYTGNRYAYESECNTVGWALAELNPNLRGKRGLIQRAVDSWRNSNQDPKLRSRRVRRMAKISTRKTNASSNHNQHGMPGPGNAPGMPIPGGNMGGLGGVGNLKSSMNDMDANGGHGGQRLAHHHHSRPDGSASGGGDESSGNDSSYMDDASQHHHHHQHTASNTTTSSAKESTSGPVVQFASYPTGDSTQYPPPSAMTNPPMQQVCDIPQSTQAPLSTRHTQHHPTQSRNGQQPNPTQQEYSLEALFGNIPEDKKRKFILVLDESRGAKVRVRVTLDTVNPEEIPDSYRKSNSVFPRSWFPIQMQSPPPSAGGSRFFIEDDDDIAMGGNHMRGKSFVQVPLPDGSETSLAVPRCKRSNRTREVMINDLGYRMTWHQSRVFAGRTVFLQKALDCYRNKVRSTMDSIGQDVQSTVPHFETRIGKRRFNERKRKNKRDMST